MHVLLDARTVLGRKTGDRTYWLGLLAALPVAAPDWQFTAALDAEPPPGVLPQLPNLRVAVVTRPAGRSWSLVALPRLAVDLGVDLVHVQYVAPPWLPCPYVTTIHDCSFVLFPETFPRWDGAWLRTLVPPSARRAAAVVAVSETTRRDLLRLYRLPPGRVVAAPNGISSAFHPVAAEVVERVRHRYGLPEPYLLSVGVLQPRKNLAVLVEAYAEAHRSLGVTAPLAIVGKVGWDVAPLVQRIHTLGLADMVRLMGYVPDEDLPALYCGAALTLYPSLYEGFGLPPLESMACGTPALVSTAPALVEVTGRAAVHLPPNDSAAWARAIARFLDDEQARQRLIAPGRARAARYTWQRSARHHLAAYRQAVAGR